MEVLRTPEECFGGLAGYPYPPSYVEVGADHDGPLRMHYVDAGPAAGDPVLLLHGQPTWSYLYRRVIDRLVREGHRVVAPDLVGFGRSDKPVDRFAYTVAAHVRWTAALVTALDLRRVTLVVHDWGGPIGLAVLAAHPGRFARVVATNTILHTSDPDLAGRIRWANHGQGDGRVVLEEALVDYVAYTQRASVLRASDFVAFASTTAPTAEVLAGYDAPFPEARFQAGMRQFPVLIPLTGNDPAAAVNRATWSALARFDRPFLTAYSDGDEASAGWDLVFHQRVPGARGQAHRTIAGAGHFVPEEKGEELGEIVAEFAAASPPD